MIALSGISKRFGATTALEAASFSLSGGEICGLVGHNGAGKSTLIKIIAGVQAPDTGFITVDGSPVHFGSPADSFAAGIRVIHQDAPLVPGFDAVDNCFLGRPYPRRLGTLDKTAMRAEIAAIAAEIAPGLPLDVPVAHLPPAERQFVKLLRAVADAGRILILDEPTASLPAEDVERLFAVLRRLKARGTGIVLVSHRLDEIVGLCDRAVVLRDGRIAAEFAGAELTVPALVVAMGGTHGVVEHTPPPPGTAPIVLQLDQVTANALSAPVNFGVRAGEVVVLYGLAGSGRSGLLQALWGAERLTGGTVSLAGQPYHPRSPRDAVRAGMSYVPADRHRTGLFGGFDLVFNNTLPLLSSYRKWGRLPLPHPKAERSAFTRAAQATSMQFGSPFQLAGTLSGGNQQKLIFSRWANRHSVVMLLDEPTEGIDVMAKRTVKDIIAAIAGDGNAVLVSTSDREEALELGDRILVFRDGAIVAEFARHDASAEALSTAAQARLAHAS